MEHAQHMMPNDKGRLGRSGEMTGGGKMAPGAMMPTTTKRVKRGNGTPTRPTGAIFTKTVPTARKV